MKCAHHQPGEETRPGFFASRETPEMQWDLGDVVAEFNLRVKGHHRHAVAFHIGPPVDTTATDRVIKPPPYHQPTGKVNAVMDLQADKKVALATQWTDEVGNPTAAPEGATTVYSVDDPTVINLTDNGDGTASAAAVGTLGSATVHLEATADGQTLTGDLLIVVVSGLAERVTITPGEVTEVTEDV